MKAVYTTGQIAKLAGVSMQTVHRWLDRKLLKGHRMPGTSERRVGGDDLLAFFKKHQLSHAVRRLQEARGDVVLLGGNGKLANLEGVRRVETWVQLWTALADEPDGLVLDLSAGREEAVRTAKHLMKEASRPTIVALVYGDEPKKGPWDVVLPYDADPRDVQYHVCRCRRR